MFCYANKMRQAIIFLFAILALFNCVVLSAPAVDIAANNSAVGPAAADLDLGFEATTSPLLPNGDYRIYTGINHYPRSWSYFTGFTGSAAWAVSLLPKSTNANVLQVWRLRNHSSGLISLELVGKTGYYLGEGGEGNAAPGIQAGTGTKQQKWRISRSAGGDLTRYKLTFPTEFNGETLVLDEISEDVNVYFQYEVQDRLQAWKISPV
ncbi:hypothetical protein BGX23_010644 [Mortierella sp. AD031]|nr:hypothetical protein BGX23_010644 [Mortierella sp. AD031]